MTTRKLATSTLDSKEDADIGWSVIECDSGSDGLSRTCGYPTASRVTLHIAVARLRLVLPPYLLRGPADGIHLGTGHLAHLTFLVLVLTAYVAGTRVERWSLGRWCEP